MGKSDHGWSVLLTVRWISGYWLDHDWSFDFKTRLLHTFRHRRHSFDLNLLWPLQHIDTNFQCWNVGRLSNHLRLLSRPDHATTPHCDPGCYPKIQTRSR